MFNGFSDKLTLTKSLSGEVIELDQRRVRIRENQSGLMALSYIAPIFDVMDLENFFDSMDSSGKLVMDIGGAGGFNVNFRGIIDGKAKNFSKNLDHKIILLEQPRCSRPGEYFQI
ncbi:MAG: hypothetical protein E7Z80_03020 [Methanobrevibacter thaueri]|nr:hypothetical protein [Methanobrevibacter thaueri]